MNFKRYVEASDTWVDSHYIMGTDTDTITTLPADLYADGNNATVGLVGNMYQASGVSPTNPIQPSECGDRTGNLFIQKLTGVTINSLGGVVSDANYDTYIAEVSDGETYTVSNVTGTQVFGFFTTKPALGTITYNSSRTVFSTSSQTLTVPTGENIKYIGARYNTGVSNAMFNTGETALPYEPYGYKIPISSANITTPVYLGEVQSTRQIKKYEFTGQENWIISSGWKGLNTSVFYYNVDDLYSGEGEYIRIVYSDKFASASRNELYNGDTNMIGRTGSNAITIRISDSLATTTEAYKQYLAEQYANGTPVTVWYVLATPTTGIFNEPIRKIGDYADTVSGITIPTIAGANTLSVDTTLQPSEVTVNYKGWHPVANVHEYDSNYTIATMQALTIAQLQTHTINDLQGGEWS